MSSAVKHLASVANPANKILMVVGIIFVIVAIILLPSGLSTLLKGNIISGICLLAAGALIGFAGYKMVLKK